MANYYDYKELLLAAQNGNGEDGSADALGEWMEQYGSAYWNGEYYDISEEGEPSGSLRLYPVYAEVSYCIADDSGTLYGHDLRKETAEAALANIIDECRQRGDAVPEGLEIVEQDDPQVIGWEIR